MMRFLRRSLGPFCRSTQNRVRNWRQQQQVGTAGRTPRQPMPERRSLDRWMGRMTDVLPTEVTVLTDINVLAIALTEDHPTNDDVYPWIQNALDGPNVLLVFDYYPLRAQSLMTSNFGVDATAARNAIQSLVRSPARIVSATETTILEAYEISAEKTTTCTIRLLWRSHVHMMPTICSQPTVISTYFARGKT